MIDLTGKVAVVCGASEGIGRSIAQVFASCGARILAVARSKEKLIDLLGVLPRSEEHRFFAQDLSQYEVLCEALQGEIGRQGRCDILINNTGGPKAGLLQGAKDSEFVEAMRVHVLASQALVKTLVPFMKSNGRIINIISTSVRNPIPGLGVSNTIRAAMAAWAKTLSQELGPQGITVNSILPGYTETGRLTSLLQSGAEAKGVSAQEIARQWRQAVPLGRFAKPEEIAYAAAFLASPLAAYISGVVLPVDGGRSPSI